MTLTVTNKGETLFSICDGVAMMKASSDWAGVVSLWLFRGLEYPYSHNHMKVIRPQSKTFLSDLQEYMKLTFPNFEYSLS